MTDILTDRSETTLVTAIEQNLSAWLPVCARLEGAWLDETPCLRRVITNAPIPLFNSIMDARLTPDNADSTIDRIQDDASSRDVPVQWWIGPSTTPSDLAARLLAHGFQPDDGGPGMAVDLDQLHEGRHSLPACLHVLCAGLSILPANDDAALWSWCQAMAAGFELPASKVDFAIQQWHTLLSRVDPSVIMPFTAWLDGSPVATSLLLLGGGVAGIYAVATIPAARRKGIGARVTLHPLKVARSLGYRTGILQASEMGLPVYRSLGFQEYCLITSYSWSPARR